MGIGRQAQRRSSALAEMLGVSIDPRRNHPSATPARAGGRCSSIYAVSAYTDLPPLKVAGK